MARLIPATVALFVAAVAISNSEAHEAVVVDVDNTNGVVFELCKNITYATVKEKEKQQAFYETCTKWAFKQMYPKQYEHDHS